MCVVSDYYKDKWDMPIDHYGNYVTLNEFLKLKEEVMEMKELLRRALDYDKRNNEPECQLEDKIAKLKEIANIVGVDLTDILK